MSDDQLAELARLSGAEQVARAAAEESPTEDNLLAHDGAQWAWERALKEYGHELLNEVVRLRMREGAR